MRKASKIISLILVTSLLISVCLSTTVFADSVYNGYKSDTGYDVFMQPNQTYTFRLTPDDKNNVMVASTGDSSSLRVISSVKKANSYYITIKAIGALKSVTGVYVGIKGSQLQRMFRVKIVGKYDVHIMNMDNGTEGLYGILEAEGDSRVILNAGVFQPLRKTFDPSYTYGQNAYNIGYNIGGCELINGGFVHSGNGSGAFANFVEEDGKMGLQISAWRKSKDDNSQAGVLNGVLSAMVYLSDKTTGESLWSWLDNGNINSGYTGTDSFGFKDVGKTTLTSGTIMSSTGKMVTCRFESGTWTFLFN